jgi:hypothetical protein
MTDTTDRYVTFLIHSNLQEFRGLFETREDEEALKLLDELEEKCC